MNSIMQRIVLSLIFLLGGNLALLAQNSLDPTLQQLETKSVQRLPEGSIFLKTYPADVLGSTQEWVEYSVSLQSGGKYIFSVADLDHGNTGALVFIYDRSQHKMASNYHNDKIYPSFEFHCQGSGIYKIFIAFKESTVKKACVAMGKRID